MTKGKLLLVGIVSGLAVQVSGNLLSGLDQPVVDPGSYLELRIGLMAVLAALALLLALVRDSLTPGDSRPKIPPLNGRDSPT